MIKLTVSDKGNVTIITDPDMDVTPYVACVLTARMALLRSVCRRTGMTINDVLQMEAKALRVLAIMHEELEEDER